MKIDKRMECIEDWFDHWYGNRRMENVKPIAQYIGKTGVGKKTRIAHLVSNFNLETFDMNCFFEKTSRVLNKRTCIQEFRTLMTQRGIDFYIRGRKHLIVVHNFHLLKDKAFIDDFLELCELKKVMVPIVCILNQTYVSERLLSYISKRCDCFYLHPRTPSELYELAHENYGPFMNGDETQALCKKSSGNIRELFLQCNIKKIQELTNHRCASFDSIAPIDSFDAVGSTSCVGMNETPSENTSKNTSMGHSFELLCSASVKWKVKHEVVKANGSLLKMLMSTHVCLGLDKQVHTPFPERLNMALDCMSHLSGGEATLYAKKLNVYMQWFYPTRKVSNVSIKTMTLPNFPSTSNLPTTRIYPYTSEDICYIAHTVMKFFQKTHSSQGCSIDSLKRLFVFYPYLTLELVYKLRTQHSHTFDTTCITKKKLSALLQNKFK